VSNYILTLPLKTEKFQEDILNKKFEECRNIYNACISQLHKRYNHMRESKEYQRICKMAKGKDRNKKFNNINKIYNITEYSLHKYAKYMCKYYKMDAQATQKIATRAWDAFSGLMFHTAKHVKYKAYGELNSIEGKTNSQGIRYRDGKLLFLKLKVPVIIKSKDIYAEQSLENPIKYCRIKREIMKGKYHYYVQLILEGVPPTKLNNETGELKGLIGEGNVGIDIGTQTIAYSSQFECKLLELAPDVDNIENIKRVLSRKLDRQRRANNPNKYNENGTIIKGNREKWNKSKNYFETYNKLKDIQRKQSSIRKQSHNILANQLLNLGNKFYVETMNYSGLQRRSKNTTINPKTGKFNKKKRFGKSITNKAPSMFLTILDNKLKWNGEKLYKINTYKVKASQYNHFDEKYNKKQLSERWNYFNVNNEEIKIQRDLYSSFLIMNVKDNLEEIDRDLCNETYDNFKYLHDNEINRLLSNNDKKISSMGI